MKQRWLAMEHYRLERIASWPESAYKDAALKSARASIAMLSNGMHRCGDCAAPADVIEFPAPRPLRLHLAA